MDASKETIFYHDEFVTITQSRFVTQSKTYAMSNISSVSLYVMKRSRGFEIFLLVVGVLLLVAESTRVVGGIFIIIGVALLFLLKDSYSVRINSNSGEADGIVSKDRAYIQKIVSAINEAIVHRG